MRRPLRNTLIKPPRRARARASARDSPGTRSAAAGGAPPPAPPDERLRRREVGVAGEAHPQLAAAGDARQPPQPELAVGDGAAARDGVPAAAVAPLQDHPPPWPRAPQLAGDGG